MSYSADVLVVGAGPGGIAAATAAAVHGKRVIVLDDNPAAGGQIWRTGVNAKPVSARLAALDKLRASGARVMNGRRVFDAPKTGVLRAICEAGDRTEFFEYERLVLATGARERFLPFPGWTLPGVFGAGGLQALVQGGYDVAGKRVVVAGSGPLLMAVAAHLKQAGAKVVCVAEQASMDNLVEFATGLVWSPGRIWQGARYRMELAGTSYRMGCWPVEAVGERWLRGVRLTDGNKMWEEPCDLLACGFHLVPNTELAELLGCELRDGFVQVDENQQTSVTNVYCAGEPTGIGGLDAALIEGEIAGLAAAGEVVKARALWSKRDKERKFATRLAKAFVLRDELRAFVSGETIVCRCEDVRWKQLVGYPSWTEAKLQTRCGMGPCQGRICGPVTEFLFGWKPVSVRSPIFPVPVSAICSKEEATEERR